MSMTPEISSSSATRIIIGINPFNSGIPFSCIGTAARSEISRATTSSEAAAHRAAFSIILIAVIMNMYIITVRIAIIAICTPFQLWFFLRVFGIFIINWIKGRAAENSGFTARTKYAEIMQGGSGQHKNMPAVCM